MPWRSSRRSEAASKFAAFGAKISFDRVFDDLGLFRSILDLL